MLERRKIYMRVCELANHPNIIGFLQSSCKIWMRPEVYEMHRCAIRQGFAASLLITPLFFSRFLVEFLASNEEGMGSRAYIGGQSRSPEGGRATGPPCRPWVGPPSCPSRPPSRPWGGDRPPLPPRAPVQGALCKLEEKKLH